MFTREDARHTSAARFHGLPIPLDAPPDVTLTGTVGPTQHRGGVHLRVAPWWRSEVREPPGIRVTSPARTVVDCARILHPRDGLAIADAALKQRLTCRSELERVVGRQAGWRGVGTARKVLELADGRRESPLESWSYLIRAKAFGQEPSAQELQKVLDAEKKRDRRIRGAGADVVHWYSEDVLVASRLRSLADDITYRRAVALTHPTFTGTIRP